MNRVTASLETIRGRIAAAEAAYGRPAGSVTLLAVSKTHPPEAVEEAYRAGQRAFGENYLQEALTKIQFFSGKPLEWHFIGPIQSNKTRPIAQHFAWVHSVDRLRIAERLSRHREGLSPLNVCVQVNVSNEPTKAGVVPAETLPLARAVAALPNLALRGLMAIPAPVEGFEAQRGVLRPLAELFAELRKDGLQVDTLSMGMTDDLEAAIAEGSTLVRIGTAIFGPRRTGPGISHPLSTAS